MPVLARLFLPCSRQPGSVFPTGSQRAGSCVEPSTNKEIESQIPNYPNMSPRLICQLHNVTMHVSMEIWSTFFHAKITSLLSLCFIIGVAAFNLMLKQIRYMHR